MKEKNGKDYMGQKEINCHARRVERLSSDSQCSLLSYFTSVFHMAITWGLLLVIAFGMTCTSVLCVPPNHYCTVGEDATITFSQPLDLDKSLQVYTWSLQYAHTDRPFYVNFGVDADGTFYTDMLKSPDQLDRMSVTFEMRDSVLLVTLSITHVHTSDAATYLLTVAEKGSTQALSVQEAFLHVLPRSPRNTDDTFLGPINFSSLAYTAPQVKTWRNIRISAVGEEGAIFYCYFFNPSSGKFIAGHVFHRNNTYNKIVMVNVDSNFYCCMMCFPYRERCEYYKIGSTGNLTLLSETQREMNYAPSRKPPTSPATDATDLSFSSQSTTQVKPELNVVIQNLLTAFFCIIIYAFAYGFLKIVVCIWPHTCIRSWWKKKRSDKQDESAPNKTQPV